jgi:hypothetical protein
VSDLVTLARRFVALSEELEAVRNEIRRCVLDGVGEAPVRPPKPAGRSGGSKDPAGRQHPARAKAAEIEGRIVAALTDQPGLRTAQIARATEANVSSTSERLRRLREKGLVQGRGDSGWTATVATRG